MRASHVLTLPMAFGLATALFAGLLVGACDNPSRPGDATTSPEISAAVQDAGGVPQVEDP